jgi:hypothetical protein
VRQGTWRRLLSVLLSLSVVLYLGYQIYSLNHDVIQTEYALEYTHYQTLPLEGIFVRDEMVLTTSADGVVGYCQPTGSKVAAGHVVAKVFENSNQAAIQAQIDDITATINNLESLQTDGTQLSANIEILDSRIDQAINKILYITDRGTTAGMESVSDDLIQLLNKKQMVLGNSGDFTGYLASLKAEKASLESSLSTYTTIMTDTPGYFINPIDGYENILDYHTITEISYEKLTEALFTKPNTTEAVGKMVSSNEWYFAATVDSSAAQYIGPDDMVDITLPLISDETYSCRVAALNIDYAEDTTVIVLHCSQMNQQLAQARIENAQLRLRTHRGLRVNQAALRVVDGVTGVYVVSGITAKFRPVDILYSDTDFAICAYDAANTNSLVQYDEVIVRGGDLYDGKIIR